MKPQFDDPLQKREQFAVNLRKKKQQEIIQQKRRKIVDSITKRKADAEADGDQQIEFKDDKDLTV